MRKIQSISLIWYMSKNLKSFEEDFPKEKVQATGLSETCVKIKIL